MNEQEKKQLLSNEIEIIFRDGLALFKKKNADYARASDDGFGGFRDLEIDNLLQKSNLPFDSVVLDLLVTMGHKNKRIKGLLLSTEPAQVNESLQDTIVDLINYNAILLAYLRLRTK